MESPRCALPQGIMAWSPSLNRTTFPSPPLFLLPRIYHHCDVAVPFLESYYMTTFPASFNVTVCHVPLPESYDFPLQAFLPPSLPRFPPRLDHEKGVVAPLPKTYHVPFPRSYCAAFPVPPLSPLRRTDHYFGAPLPESDGLPFPDCLPPLLRR